MASPVGTSSGSSSLQQNSSSEEEMQVQVMDDRKRKRMQSNRESARRSRMRKQKHLDDLMTQVSNLSKNNHQLMNNINITTQHYLKVEAENSVLRAQMSELSSRLQSLNEINSVLNSSNNNRNLGFYGGEDQSQGEELFTILQGTSASDYFLMNTRNSATCSCLNQPIMASANMFQY